MSTVQSTAGRQPSALAEFWYYFSRNKGAVLGLAIFLLVLFIAVFAPLIAPHSPIEQYRDKLLLPSQATTAREALPMVSHLTLPECGHVPMIDNPELVAGAIVQTVVQAADRAGQPLLHLTGA